MQSSIDWRKALLEPVYFAREVLKVNPHPGQIEWLNNSKCRENLLVTGNRWGKSFVSAVKILHRAIFRLRNPIYDKCGKYHIVTASITQDQANIIFNQTVRLARESKILEPLILTITRSPFPKMTFANGSIIEARSTQNRGEYLLGNDYDYFIFDEVAFETDSEYVIEEVIKMRLADREGVLDLVSTPNGKNWFFTRAREINNKTLNGYFQNGDSRQNIYISRAALDERMDNFNEHRLQQNIMGKFVDSGAEIIKSEFIARAIENFDKQNTSFKNDIQPVYISGWDLARKKTATVGITVEINNEKARVVKLERFKRFDWLVIIEKIKKRQIDFPGQLVMDATGLGDVITQQLSEYNPQAVIFTPRTKAEMLTNVELFHERECIAYQDIKLPDGPGKIWSLADELRSALWDNNNQCDALMALALAMYPLAQKKAIDLNPRTALFKA